MTICTFSLSKHYTYLYPSFCFWDLLYDLLEQINSVLYFRTSLDVNLTCDPHAISTENPWCSIWIHPSGWLELKCLWHLWALENFQLTAIQSLFGTYSFILGLHDWSKGFISSWFFVCLFPFFWYSDHNFQLPFIFLNSILWLLYSERWCVLLVITLPYKVV